MQISYRCTDSPILDSIMVGLEADNLEKIHMFTKSYAGPQD